MKDYSMIKELYLRRLGTSEQPMITDEQREQLDKVATADKGFREKHSNNGDVMEAYEKFYDAEAEYLCKVDENAYCHGFRVGVLVGLDVAKIFENKD